MVKGFPTLIFNPELFSAPATRTKQNSINNENDRIWIAFSMWLLRSLIAIRVNLSVKVLEDSRGNKDIVMLTAGRVCRGLHFPNRLFRFRVACDSRKD